jgi:ribonucleoside-triphosphate reductase
VDNMLPTPYQQFIHKSRYARWLDTEQRRENWDETVDRYLKFMVYQAKGPSISLT